MPITWSLATSTQVADEDGLDADDNADLEDFMIDSEDGMLKFNISDTNDGSSPGSPDFENPQGGTPASNTYKVVVAACDVSAPDCTGGQTGYHKVTVMVTDVVEAGEIEVALSEVSSTTAMQFRFGTILTATVTDGDVSGPTKTAPSPIFRWYRGSTEISDATAAAYTTTAEDVGSRIRVEATYVVTGNVDQKNASWTSDYPVLPTRVGDNKLKFDPATLERTVAEGEEGMNVGAAVRATGSHGVVTYSLPDVSDNAQFEIDEKTGQIKTKEDLDYEGTDIAGGNCTAQNECVVRVMATDASAMTAPTGTPTADPPVFADATVNIELTDVNEKPTFTVGADNNQAKTAISSPENEMDLYGTDRATADGFETAATAVTYAATDPEDRSLTYHLMGPDRGKFQLSDTQVLSFKAKPDYEMPTDANRNNVYEVTVRASDGTLNEDRMVMVTVIAVDDAPAVSGLSSKNYAENGTDPVATFTATDPEGAMPITWSLATSTQVADEDGLDADDNADLEDFMIDSEDGMLKFNISDTNDGSSPGSPDFENPQGGTSASNTYKVVVAACDVSAPDCTGGQTGYHKVTVMVTDVAEAGEIEVVLSGSASSPTAMQFRFGTTLTATVMDGDLPGGNKTVTSPTLRWHRGSTEISDATAAAYTTTAEDVNSRIRVEATYRVAGSTTQKNASWTSDYPVLATLVGDNKLKFDPATLERTVAEGEEGMNVGAAVRATGSHGAVTYSLPDVSDNAQFEIDEKTGQIKTAVDLDYEGTDIAGGNCTAQNECVVRVRATDASAMTAPTGTPTADPPVFADATVNIELTDVDEKPTFTTGYQMASIPEGTTVVDTDADENNDPTTGESVYVATDQDGLNVNLALMGSDAAKFSLSSGGVLSFMTEPDYEMPSDANRDNVYMVTVRATDGTLNEDRMVTVNVSNVDEAPEIIRGGLAISGMSSVSRMEGSSTAVATYTASGPASAAARWTLSGTDALDFSIGSTSGVLTFRAAPDFDAPADANGDNVYMVTVMATSGDYTARRNVTVTVTEVDDGTVTPMPGDTVPTEFVQFDTDGVSGISREEVLQGIDDFIDGGSGNTREDILDLIDYFLDNLGS